MAYNIASLDEKLRNYIDGNKAVLISDVVFNQNTLTHFNLQTGVKATVPIVKMDNSVTFQDGTTCGFSAEGDTTFTNRLLTPSFIKVQKEWCAKDLLKSAFAQEVMVGAGKEKMPFEEKITSDLVAKIGEKIEFSIWQGTVSSEKIDGVLTQIEKEIANATIPTENVIAKASDNVATRVKKLWKALPAKMADAPIYMSISNFKQFVLELQEANNYHYTAREDGTYQMTLPYGVNTVYGIAGMEGKDVIFATPTDNLYYGCDAENDEESFDLWYDKNTQLFKFDCEFALATNYAIPSNIYVSTEKA